MAKKREINVASFNMTDAGVELKAKVTFSLKLFEGDVAQEHVANMDLSMSKDAAIKAIMSSEVIDFQKVCRATGDHAKVRALTAKTIGYKDIHPEGRTVVKREMSEADIIAKAKNDPVFRAAILAGLGQ
jgi:hypothetical protein